jgi:hypothetical protein
MANAMAGLSGIRPMLLVNNQIEKLAKPGGLEHRVMPEDK